MAAVPGTHTFSNTIRDSSEENTFIRDPLLFLFKPPMAELVQIAVQSIATSTWTALTFTSHVLDQDYAGGLMHSDSVNTSRATANYAGWYLLGGGVGWAVNAAGVRGTRWAVNGTTVSASWTFLPATAATGAAYPARAKRVYLNVGDYVELQAFQTTGSPLNTEVTAEIASSLTIGWASN